MKPKILFVCTNNAGRSQMAETVFRGLCGDKVKIFSAGVDPWPDVHPIALRLMNERGLSMAGQYPKHIEFFAGEEFDYIITIGNPAKEGCLQSLRGRIRIHWDITDPALRTDAEPEEIFCSTLKLLDEKLADLRKEFLTS